MRVVAVVLVLVGIGLGFGYPWAVRNATVRDIGTWRVQDTGGGFRGRIDVELAAGTSPVEVRLDAWAVPPPDQILQQSVLAVTVGFGGRTVLAEAVGLADGEVTDDTPQTPQKLFRLVAGSFTPAESGTYGITVTPGDAEAVDLKSVDLRLANVVGEPDARALPVGLTLAVLGGVLLLLSLRGGTPSNPNSQPPPPRWGRGAARDPQ